MFLEISSKSNNKIKHVKNLVNSAKYRKEKRQFVIEGMKIAKEAIKTNIEILECFFIKKNEDTKDIIDFSEQSFKINESLMSFITNTKTPQGIVCVLKILEPPKNLLKSNRFLILEDIQDPGNLGTIIRNADAFSLDALVLSKNCCDIYSPKVLRSTAGSIFRTRVFLCDNLLSVINKIKDKGFTVLASDVKKKNTISIKNIQKDKLAIVIGNESKGVSKDIQRISSEKVHIPMSRTAESLNASIAASIFMWEMFKNDKR